MPVIPSEVDGTNPGDGITIDVASKRLRELCEVLLTARAKMLGLSQSFASRFSQLPDHMKSGLVAAIAEIVAHLDSFDIRPGDTRITGKVRLGSDAGMEGHFPGDEILERWVPPDRGRPTVIDSRKSTALSEGDSSGPRRRRKRHEEEVDRRRAARANAPEREEEEPRRVEVAVDSGGSSKSSVDVKKVVEATMEASGVFADGLREMDLGKRERLHLGSLFGQALAKYQEKMGG